MNQEHDPYEAPQGDILFQKKKKSIIFKCLLAHTLLTAMAITMSTLQDGDQLSPGLVLLAILAFPFGWSVYVFETVTGGKGDATGIILLLTYVLNMFFQSLVVAFVLHRRKRNSV